MADLHRKILDASIELITEHGVRAVSFREVARRAGVSHQAPYHHFGSYLGILRALAREGFASLAEAMQRAAEGAKDGPLEALEAAGIAYVRFARMHVGHFRVMFQQSLVDLHDEQEPVAEAEATHGTLVRLAQAAVQAGYGAGLPVEDVTHLCWSTVHGLSTLLVEGTLGPKGPQTEAQEAALVRSVVGGMRRLLETRADPPRTAPSRARRVRRRAP